MTIVLNDQNEFVYYDGADTMQAVDALSLSGFSGMAPGDERTETMELRNDSGSTVNFYVSQRTLDTLEEDNQAAGGAYLFSLGVGQSKEAATPLLESQAGGYNANGKGSVNGLSDVDELEDYTFLATVEPGESTSLFLTLKLEGEGNDNQGSADYTDAIAHLELSFRAYDVEREVTYGDPETVTRVVDRVITTTRTELVKTGDSMQYAFSAVVLLLGIGLVVGALIRKWKGDGAR